MARIKTGQDVAAKSDVQNLITSFIFQSEQPFSICEAVQHVQLQMQGSPFIVSETEIREMTVETVFDFLRQGRLDCDAECYWVVR